MPSLPQVPEFPSLSWSYNDGLYSINEEDVDKLLDYGENQIPLFAWSLEVYEKQVQIIMDETKQNFTSK